MEAIKEVKVALLGVGTVGTGVYKLIEDQKEELAQKVGAKISIAKILVRDKSKKREGINSDFFVESWEEILHDEEIQVVVEVMGGMEPARTYIKEALAAGKSVVTANKDLVAEHGGELLDEATAYNCDFLFEASVAGGIPIIRPLKQCLAGNQLSEVVGIVNGTTNFILTKMDQEGMDFDDALALATKLGYAEADPTADIEGYDAGRKVAIMASIAFNSRVTFSDVYTEGITRISARDIKYAKEMGCTIKLLGVAKNTGSGVEVRVHPMLIPLKHPLASVNDSFNAVFVHGHAVDDAMFYGRGAGELPTASAVVGDVIDVARDLLYNCTGRIHCTCYKNLPIKKITEIESKYFLRMIVEDKPGVLAKIADLLGQNEVSIAQVVQKNVVDGSAELVVITDKVLEQDFVNALTDIREMDTTKEISTVIRVY